MNLSEHFTLDEMTKSAYAVRKGIDNSATPAAVANLKRLCEHVLEPLRAKLGHPITVTSGYRSSTLNREVGGNPSSQHMKGEAADIECPALSTWALAKIIADSDLPFDQLICEFYVPGRPDSGWVHVSHSAEKNRRQVLTAKRERGTTVYVGGLPPEGM